MLNQQINSFTKAQERAISHFQGPCLVLAGPGSGKTKVITHRVAHLINEQKIPPEQILTITFTKAAALEMKERFLLLQPDSNAIFATFHSCFYHMLKNSKANFLRRFVTNDEKKKIFREILINQSLPTEQNLLQEADRLIGLYINQFFAIDKLPNNTEIPKDKIIDIFKEYQFALKKLNATDFDMLLVDMYHLLKDNKDIRAYWQKRFPYVLIDECQDMNQIQYEIVKLLAGEHKNVFMVGDDDQSIYGFRGSDVSLMKRFLEDYAPVRELLLDINFRSTKGIVEASQKIICENAIRFPKDVVAYNVELEGVIIKSFTFKDDMHKYVNECLQDAPEDILCKTAIICRTNQEASFWCHIMRRNKISFQAQEISKSIYDCTIFRDIESFLREETSLQNMRPYLALKFIWNGMGYGKRLEKNLETDKALFDEAKDLYNYFVEESKHYVSFEVWLKDIEGERNSYKDNMAVVETKRGIHIITMHASKGLEFDVVFLPDINKGKMPRGFLLDEATVEEERRLLYVAMTRAKRRLEIFYIKGTEGHQKQPSDFLKPLLN